MSDAYSFGEFGGGGKAKVGDIVRTTDGKRHEVTQVMVNHYIIRSLDGSCDGGMIRNIYCSVEGNTPDEDTYLLRGKLDGFIR